MTVFQTFLLLMFLTVLRRAGQVFCRMFPSLSLADFFFPNGYLRVMDFGEDGLRGEMSFSSSYHVVSGIHMAFRR